MTARYVPPHIRNRCSSNFTSTKNQESFTFNTIVSVNSNEVPGLDRIYVDHSQSNRGLATSRFAHLESTPSRGTPTAPRAMMSIPLRPSNLSRGRSREVGHGHARGNRPIKTTSPSTRHTHRPVRTISPSTRHTHRPIMGPMLPLGAMLSGMTPRYMGPMSPVGRAPPMAPRAFYAPQSRHSFMSLPPTLRPIGESYRVSVTPKSPRIPINRSGRLETKQLRGREAL